MEDGGTALMASTKSSKVNPKHKTKYRVRNWPAYEATSPSGSVRRRWLPGLRRATVVEEGSAATATV